MAVVILQHSSSLLNMHDIPISGAQTLQVRYQALQGLVRKHPIAETMDDIT